MALISALAPRNSPLICGIYGTQVQISSSFTIEMEQVHFKNSLDYLKKLTSYRSTKLVIRHYYFLHRYMVEKFIPIWYNYKNI